jgi:hypothetical protein
MLFYFHYNVPVKFYLTYRYLLMLILDPYPHTGVRYILKSIPDLHSLKRLDPLKHQVKEDPKHTGML